MKYAPSCTPLSDSFLTVLLLLLVLCGVSARVLGGFSDLWFYEILSLSLADSIQTPLDFFEHFSQDANHLFNTIYLMFLDGTEAYPLFRLHSLIASLLILVFVRPVLQQFGVQNHKIGLALFAIAAPIVVSGAEARGYAFLALATLASLYWHERALIEGRRIDYVLFLFSVVFGFLSHRGYLGFYPALLFSLLFSGRGGLHIAARLHLLPLVSIALFIACGGLELRFSAGSYWAVIESYESAALLVLGLPPLLSGLIDPYLGACGALVLAILLGLEVVNIQKTNRRHAAFMFLSIVVAPLTVMFLVNPPALYARHFLPAIVCALLLLTRSLARLIESTPRLSLLAATLCGVLFGSHLLHDARFLRDGFGSYESALSVILKHSSAERVTIGSDHDTRNWLIIAFYKARISAGERIEYIKTQEEDEIPTLPDWYIAHSLQATPGWRKSHRARDGSLYVQVAHYPYAGDSGSSWSVFQRRVGP